MFNFLNASFLFAAAAALIPLIIHLFSRRRVRIVEFSSLKHLKAMQRRQVRRLQIKQLLLLILRMLIVLAVVLAFARPTTKGDSIGSHASVSAVIMIDNSASMNRYVTDGNLFDLSVAKTRTLLDVFGEGDEIMLLPLVADQSDVSAHRFGSVVRAGEQLSRLRVTAAKADYESGLAFALDELGQANNLNRELYIISDRQANTMPQTPAEVDAGIRVYLVDINLEETENVGIVSVNFGGQLIIPGHDFTINAQVQNHSPIEASDIIASLYIDGERTAQTDISIPAGELSAIKFKHAVVRTGFHSGYIEISDDNFPGDNRFYFSFHIPERFNLLIVAGDRSAEYISLALVPSASVNQYWSVKTVAPDKLSSVSWHDYDVIVVAGPDQLSESYARRIKSYVRMGVSLFIVYGGSLDIEKFNRVWSEASGVVFDKTLRQDFTRAGYYTLQTIDPEHPIFSIFEFKTKEPPSLKFFTLPKMHTDGRARTVMRFSGDRPALVEASFGNGKVLTFTGPILPNYGDIATHAFFVPFVSRIAEYLATDLSSFEMNLTVGAPITRSLSFQGATDRVLELVAPDKSVYNLIPREESGSLTLRAEPIDAPGIYGIRQRGRQIDLFAANLAPSEGDLASVGTDQFASALGLNEFVELSAASDAVTTVAEARFGRELWQIFLWLALLFIVIEMFLSRGSSTEDRA